MRHLLLTIPIAVAAMASAARADDIAPGLSIQPLDTQIINLGLGTSREIKTGRPYSTIQIVDPEIIDVTAETDRRLNLISKRAGTTTLVVYDQKNIRIGSLSVVVNRIPDEETYKGVPGRLVVHNDPKGLAGVAVYSCTPNCDLVKEKSTSFEPPAPDPRYEVVESRRTDRDLVRGRSTTRYERREVGQ